MRITAISAAIMAFGALYLGGLLSFGVPLREGWLWDPPDMDPMERRISQTLFFFYPIVITWIADTAAYFGGRAFGKHKLSPNISPNKTIEGAVFALVAATIVAPIYSRFVLPGGWEFDILPALGLGLVVGGFAIIGDLVESALKRECGVKDSGPLIISFTPASASAGTRSMACSISGSKCSTSASSSEKWKPSGRPSAAQGMGLGS